MSQQDSVQAKGRRAAPPPAIKDPSVQGQDDGLDAARVELVRSQRWHAQDIYLLERDRNVEQHARALMGDQWSVWSPLAGTFINVAEALGLPELLWKELPRVNRLADWYDLTVARLTENPPVLGATPRDADRMSALLADAADVLLPKLWDDLRMTERYFEIVAWLATAGWTFIKSYPDYQAGDPLQGPALFPSPTGETVPVQNAAYSAQGQPMGQVVPDGMGGHVYDPGQEPPGRQGKLCVHVLTPLECRGEWGLTPWQSKRWHIHRSLVEPEVVKEHYGVDVAPDTSVMGGSASQYYRIRLSRGPGHYGATDFSGYGWGQDTYGPPTELVTVDEMWERPSAAFPEGRLLIVAGHKTVLHDGPRPFNDKLAEYDYTSPITYVEWIRVPGRPFGTTPLERGLPIQRQINLGARQILLHRAKCTNPPLIINTAFGLSEEDAEQRNEPGGTIPVELPPGTPVQAVAGYLEVGQLGPDAWKAQQWLEQQFALIMDLEGSGGQPQTGNASGEQVKELRFNSDRPISVPIRNLAAALEEQGQIWLSMLPTIWPIEKTVAYTGEDNAARTLTLVPEMWDGCVKVQINAEAMMPRSRQEREAQARMDYQLGLFGAPGSPQAALMYFKQAEYPNFDDADLPGGVDVATMKELINRVRQGTPAQAIPMLEQWNYPVMQATLREYMAAPEFLSYPPPVQAQMQMLWQMLQESQQRLLLMNTMREARAQAGVAQIQAPLAMAAAKLQGQATQAQQPPEPQPAGAGSDQSSD